MSLADVVIRLHAFAGAVALGSMWIPMFSRKGGSLHRKAGRVFTGSMACAAATALAASVLRLVERPDAPQGPVLLSLVAIQSAAATWWGVAVLRRKARDGSSRSLPDWLAAAALLVSGFLALAYWLQGAMPLIALSTWSSDCASRTSSAAPRPRAFGGGTSISSGCSSPASAH